MILTFQAQNDDFIKDIFGGLSENLHSDLHYTDAVIGPISLSRFSSMRGIDATFIAQILIAGTIAVPSRILSSWLFDRIKKAGKKNKELIIKIPNHNSMTISYEKHEPLRIEINGEKSILTIEVLNDILTKNCE